MLELVAKHSFYSPFSGQSV